MASVTCSSFLLSCSSSIGGPVTVSSSACQSTPVPQKSLNSSRASICANSPIFDPFASRGHPSGSYLKNSSLGGQQLRTIPLIVVNGKSLGSLSSEKSSCIVSFSGFPVNGHPFTQNSVRFQRLQRRNLLPPLKFSQERRPSTGTVTETETEVEAEVGSTGNDGLPGREAIAAVTVAAVASDTEAISKVFETVEKEEEKEKAEQGVSPAESFIGEELAAIYAKCQTWQWKNKYSINYMVQGSGPPVILVHGFGASIGHWRRNIGVLSENNTVYAIDLLGLGASAKPAKFVYTMETWAELLIDFLKEIVGSPAVLVGNSIGSLACLIAAAEAPEGLVRGTVLLNCAGGMNNKAVIDDWRLKLALPLLWLIDFLLNRQFIAAQLFNRIRSRANIKTVLQSIYNNKAAVDDELVEVILRPSDTPGALDAFVSIITGPPGPKPQTLMPKISNPVLLIWGDDDPFTPIDGPVGKYFSALAISEPNVQLNLLPNIGHCPHDDRPELVHEKLVPWLAALPI
ncbi:unnamed protein product [Calypogeia fissa]